MSWRLVSIFLLFSLPLLGKEEDHVLVKEAHGIVLLGESAPLLYPKALKTIEGIERIDLNIPGSFNELKEELLSFLYHPMTAQSLEEIQALIKAFYTDHSHPFVLVEIPRQDVTAGVLQVRIIESHVGQVTVVGNHWYPSERLINILDLKSGEEIDTGDLLKSLYFINQSAFVQADLLFSPGKATYTTDVTAVVKERSPYQVYAGVDDTGIESVGRERWFVGFNWGNVFGLGHTFSSQYTAALNVQRFQAVTVQYIAPLPWRHLLNVYGGYTLVHPRQHIRSMKNHGWSLQASLRYLIPLPISQHFEQDISIGADFKRTNNTFQFVEVAATIGQNVNLTQLALEYKGNYRADSYQIEFDSSVFYSPGSWLPDQSNRAYRTLRIDAKPHWVYGRGALSYLQRLPGDFSLYLLNRGQISSQNLLPSEQYGIGGYDTVRGYEERQINKDAAALSSLEIRSPYLSLAKACGAKNISEGIQFHLFLDWGWGRDHNAEVPGFKTQYLLGAGPGFRYFYDRYLSARFDLGFKIHKDHYQGGSPMIHFSVIGNY